jgi:hypothetical protein
VLPLSTRARLVAGLTTAGVLLGGALVAQQALPASAAPPAPSSLTQAQVAALTPTAPMKGRAWIEGVVKDQFGDRVGNVSVHAVSADDEGSAITYEEPGIAGSTGFYRIYDLTPGTYTVRFTSDSPKVEPLTTKLTVGKREIGRIDAKLTRVLAGTTTSATLGKATISTKDRGAVTVIVKTGATKQPVGAVELREGRAVVGEATLVKSGKGSVTVTLDKLAKGDHVLKAYFLGTKVLKPSTSRGLTLHVVKKRR